MQDDLLENEIKVTLLINIDMTAERAAKEEKENLQKQDFIIAHKYTSNNKKYI